jgi:hypothetical protein
MAYVRGRRAVAPRLFRGAQVARMADPPADLWGRWLEGWEPLAGACAAGPALAAELPKFGRAYAEFISALRQAAERARDGEGTFESRLQREFAALQQQFRGAAWRPPWPAEPATDRASADGWFGPLFASGAAGSLDPGAPRALAEALLALNEPAREYGAQLSRIALEGLHLLAARLAAQCGAKGPLAAPRAMFDDWVDCSEAAYQRALRADEFPRAQARAFNAWLTVAQAARELHARQNEWFGVPTRADFDALDERLRALEKARSGRGSDGEP